MTIALFQMDYLLILRRKMNFKKMKNLLLTKKDFKTLSIGNTNTPKFNKMVISTLINTKMKR